MIARRVFFSWMVAFCHPRESVTSITHDVAIPFITSHQALLRARIETHGVAQNPRHNCIKASLRRGWKAPLSPVGSHGQVNCAEVPEKPRCALGQPVPDVDFSLCSKPPWIGLPERSRTMKLSFASGTSGACAPTRFSVLVRDEAAYKTLKFERLPRSFRLRYRRISLVAHPQFAR